MRVECRACGDVYNDDTHWTFCPHDEFIKGHYTVPKRNAIGQWVEIEVPFDAMVKEIEEWLDDA